MQEYRDESEIHSYQQIKLSNNKFVNGIVRLIWIGCKICQKSNHDFLGAGWMN